MSFGLRAQVVSDKKSTASDSIMKTVSDSATIKLGKVIVPKLAKIRLDSVTLKPFKPDPLKSVWMGAILPGYGQILNHKYWKLPIVYGGFLGCAYAITWNGGMFQTYNSAYRDITDNDPKTNSFLDILPKGFTMDSPQIGGRVTWQATITRRRDIYRRYRDLSVIVAVGVYALTLVDAYVDAQLYDFDISPDLSLHVQPTLLENSYGQRNTFGMQCCINLK